MFERILRDVYHIGGILCWQVAVEKINENRYFHACSPFVDNSCFCCHKLLQRRFVYVARAIVICFRNDSNFQNA